MTEDIPEAELRDEPERARAQLNGLQDEREHDRAPQLDAPSPAGLAFPGPATEHPAVTVLEHIYRDMIAGLQQMYRDTIAAKDDALAGRDREIKTKDELIEHLRRRAEDAEARASQALRYIGEMDQMEARDRSTPGGSQAMAEPKKEGFFRRLFSGA